MEKIEIISTETKGDMSRTYKDRDKKKPSLAERVRHRRYQYDRQELERVKQEINNKDGNDDGC